jgi:hypothetical protein
MFRNVQDRQGTPGSSSSRTSAGKRMTNLPTAISPKACEASLALVSDEGSARNARRLPCIVVRHKLVRCVLQGHRGLFWSLLELTTVMSIEHTEKGRDLHQQHYSTLQ